MTTDKVSYEHLLGISACLVLSLAAHLTSLPIWVLATVLVCIGIRLALARRGSGPPPKALFLTIGALAIALLFLRFHTFNGLAAGSALLALTAGLKLLETATKRDIYIITLVIYFVSLAALLAGDSFWLLAYLSGVCWLTTATLLRLTSARAPPDWRVSLRYAGRVLAQALPIALVFWLFFPRFAGPLWQMPGSEGGATTGLSDSMSPGDITDLALSDEIAFRVHFNGPTPPSAERYWRGPVLDYFFDGRTWRQSRSGAAPAPHLETQGTAFNYRVSLEPHQHNWLYALDRPSSSDQPDARINGEYTLVQREPVSRPIDVTVTSYTHTRSIDALDPAVRRRETQLPRAANPQTTQLAQTMRTAHVNDLELVRAVLEMIHRQNFYYTLSPPRLADSNSIDDFLFNTRRGFCGHYASAFTVLMRAAGIPARVVTGYQGGTFNRFADYWIVRQSEAHAWSEVWIDGQGWTRVDPTSAIAPERNERSANEAAGGDESLVSQWQRRTWLADMRLRLDALRQVWRQRILRYDQAAQNGLLERLHIPAPDGEKLVLVLAIALTLALVWLTWQVRRELTPAPKDLALRAYARLGTKLAAAGMPRLPHEGPESYARRVSGLRPDLSAEVTRLCRHYSALRYALPTPALTVGQFAAGVRALRIRRRDFPASS